MMKRLLIVLLLLPLFSNADSDGDYCNCKGFLAYELRWQSDSINQKNEHLLRIIRLDERLKVLEVILPDFQLHNMGCNDSTVFLLSWRHLYTVKVEKDTAYLSNSVEVFEGYKNRGYCVNKLWEQKNLGHINGLEQDSSFVLLSQDTSAQYLLHIDVEHIGENDENGNVMFHYHTTSKLYRKNQQGLIRKELLLFKGIQRESIH